MSRRAAISASGSAATCRRAHADGVREVAARVGLVGQAAEQPDDLRAVRLAQRRRPLLVEPGQQLARAHVDRARQVAGVAQAPELRQVDRREVVAQPQPLAVADQRGARVAEGRAERPGRLAQALARALVGHVGAQAGGEDAARVGAGVHGQPRQQAAGARRGGQVELGPVHVRPDAPDHADAQHGGQRKSSGADGRETRAETVARRGPLRVRSPHRIEEEHQ